MRKLIVVTLLVSLSLPSFASDDKPEIAVKFSFKERIYNPANGENTDWSNVPATVVSFPFTKLQYEVVPFITSLGTESVTRSPIHNAMGTFEEAKHLLSLIKKGAFDIIRGILNPKNAAAVDGLLELTDAGLSVIRVAGGVVKTGASLIAYPIYRATGGKQSTHVTTGGKRGTIITVDTGTFYLLDLFLDHYGEQIVRYHLQGVSDFYCAVTNDSGDVEDCLKKMPYDIETVDFVALTHSGGDSRNERHAERVALKYGFTPGLMLSIGCSDDPSVLAKVENTMGQQGTSWAVHFYLSSAIGKRLRGIPMNEAAKQAYSENIPLNYINPVSLGARGSIGYDGSNPAVFKDEDERLKQSKLSRYYKWNSETRNYERTTDFSKPDERAKLLFQANVVRLARYLDYYWTRQISDEEILSLIHVMDVTPERLVEEKRELIKIGVDEIRIEELESLMYKDGFDPTPQAKI